MAKPTEKNKTGVESYNHTRLGQLAEYHEARKALDALAHAGNDAGLEIGQAEFLKTVEQMAASLPYNDSSAHESSECPGNIEGAWPYKLELDEDAGWVSGTYRCAYCGQEWTMGYAVNIGDFI